VPPTNSQRAWIIDWAERTDSVAGQRGFVVSAPRHLTLCRSSDRLKMRGAARLPGRPDARIPSSSRRCARHMHGGAQGLKVSPSHLLYDQLV
jgi:hypothetical protein